KTVLRTVFERGAFCVTMPLTYGLNKSFPAAPRRRNKVCIKQTLLFAQSEWKIKSGKLKVESGILAQSLKFKVETKCLLTIDSNMKK
ncbi:MAG: hypothetical protein II453_15055, partial [Alphaproteobacteria bacterium]|nr:hypothetical protein [Alphaproteobacteria bacterium]